MSRLTNKGQGSPFSLFQTTSETVATAPFTSLSSVAGERFDASDGREFVIVCNGAVALAPGKLIQAPPIVANHQNIAVTAYSAASSTVPYTTVTVTLGATAATVNQYAGGYLVVSDNAGEGQTLKIQSHPAANLSTSLVLTLEDTPTTAITTASEVCLIPNLYVGVVINPTTATNTPIGVSIVDIAASTASPLVATNTAVYGFIQTKGPVSCLNGDADLTVGSAISPSNATAGAVENGVIAQGFVGRALQAGVNTEYRTVYIDL